MLLDRVKTPTSDNEIDEFKLFTVHNMKCTKGNERKFNIRENLHGIITYDDKWHRTGSSIRRKPTLVAIARVFVG